MTDKTYLFSKTEIRQFDASGNQRIWDCREPKGWVDEFQPKPLDVPRVCAVGAAQIANSSHSFSSSILFKTIFQITPKLLILEICEPFLYLVNIFFQKIQKIQAAKLLLSFNIKLRSNYWQTRNGLPLLKSFSKFSK